jgi:hypothetical protein
VTADRGFGKQSLVELFQRKGIGSLFIMREDLLKCHPFIGASHLRITRAEDIESATEALNGERSDEEDSHCETFGEVAVGAAADGEAAGGEDEPILKTPFLIEDDAGMGQEAFFARLRSRSQNAVQAVAIREHGDEKFCKILRFLYAMPPSIGHWLNCWVYVPKQGCFTGLLFFPGSPPAGSSKYSAEGLGEHTQREMYGAYFGSTVRGLVYSSTISRDRNCSRRHTEKR